MDTPQTPTATRTEIQHDARLSFEMPRIVFMRRPSAHVVYHRYTVTTGSFFIWGGCDAEEKTVVDVVEIGCGVKT